MTNLEIGHCQILLDKRVVLIRGKIAHFGSRALNLLLCMAERPGITVSNQDLVRAGWPSTNVEETSLRVQIKNLRRTLDSYEIDAKIINHSGQGYSLVVSPEGQARAGSFSRANVTAFLSSPQIVGRETELASITDALAKCRLVTLCGPCGIGKSTIAREIERDAQRSGRCTEYVDLGQCSTVTKLEVAINTALRQVRSLQKKIEEGESGVPSLLILDEFDRSLPYVTEVISRLLPDLAEVSILACAVQPLRLESEHVIRLGPLGHEDSPMAISEAARLFIMAAERRGVRMLMSPKVKALVDSVCLRLEGHPLAIELAAAQLDAIPLEVISDQLERALGSLELGMRSCPARHESLGAAFAWQYDLLPATDQALLRRLSVFTSFFSAEAAIAVAAGDGLTEVEVFRGLANLRRTSLLDTYTSDETSGYRLSSTVRPFAKSALETSQEHTSTFRRQALRLMHELERLTNDPKVTSRTTQPRLIEDVHTALDWALGENGDANIGIDLTVAAVPVWIRHSMLYECKCRVEQALKAAEGKPDPDRKRMELHAALGGACMSLEGAGALAREAWREVHRLSGRRRDVDYRLRALWGMWVDARNQGKFREALVQSGRFGRLSRVQTQS